MIRALVSAVLLFGAAAKAAPTPPKLDAVLARMAAGAHGVRTLSGEFVQRNRLALFKEELRSRGRFYFEAPRKIRWEYVAPDRSTMILDGDHATLRTPGAAPRTFDLAHDATVRAVFDQFLMWLGPGSLSSASHSYSLAAAGTVAQPLLVLSPRADAPIARAFARIELSIGSKDGMVERIRLVEKNGDQKDIAFTHVLVNQPVPANAFR